MYKMVSREKGVWKKPFVLEANLYNSRAESGLECENRTRLRTLSIKLSEKEIWDALRECFRDCGSGEVMIMRKTLSTSSEGDGGDWS